MGDLLKELRTPEDGWSGDAFAIGAEVAERAAAEIERLRAVLYEVTTNGRWTEGEQRGEWAISNAVYETARDALGANEQSPPATVLEKVSLPEGVTIAPFSPVAYYDKHMDCIRVLTHNRSVTEHRIDGMFTVFECNHRGEFDPEYVGFSIKGVRHLFSEIGLPLEGVYALAEIIRRIITHKPGSAMSELLRIIFKDYESAGDLKVDLDPIIQGLQVRLPVSGSVWPEEERKLWLNLLEGSFKLIYKDKEAAN